MKAESPHIAEQLLSTDDAAGVVEKEAQKLELVCGEGNEGASLVDLHLEEVDGDVSEAERQGFDFFARPTNGGLDTGEKLARAEGLGHVVVGTGFEEENFVGDLGDGAEDDDRGVVRPGLD